MQNSLYPYSYPFSQQKKSFSIQVSDKLTKRKIIHTYLMECGTDRINSLKGIIDTSSFLGTV